MRNVSMLFSGLAVVFSFLGLIKVFPLEKIMPAAHACLVIPMFIVSKEYWAKKQKKWALFFLIAGVFMLIVAACRIISIIC